MAGLHHRGSVKCEVFKCQAASLHFLLPTSNFSLQTSFHCASDPSANRISHKPSGADDLPAAAVRRRGDRQPVWVRLAGLRIAERPFSYAFAFLAEGDALDPVLIQMHAIGQLHPAPSSTISTRCPSGSWRVVKGIPAGAASRRIVSMVCSPLHGRPRPWKKLPPGSGRGPRRPRSRPRSPHPQSSGHRPPSVAATGHGL